MWGDLCHDLYDVAATDIKVMVVQCELKNSIPNISRCSSVIVFHYVFTVYILLSYHVCFWLPCILFHSVAMTKTMTKRILGKERIYLAYNSIVKGSRNRNLKQKPWRKVVLWLTLCLMFLCLMFPYSGQGYLPRKRLD